MKVPFDKVVDKVAALGVPGLVLLIALKVVGFAGAAALTTALATLGGPFGMLGGIAALGILVLISGAITKYGFERILKAVVDSLAKKGKSKEAIKTEIDKYWFVSKDLKLKLKHHVDSA